MNPKPEETKTWTSPEAVADQVLSRRNGIICVDQPEGVLVIMAIGASDHFYVADGLAAECFQLIDGKRTFNEIISTVSRANRVPQKRLQDDFFECVDELIQFELIEAVMVP